MARRKLPSRPWVLLAVGAFLLSFLLQAPVRADHAGRLTLQAVQEHIDDLAAAVAALSPPLPPLPGFCDPGTYERTAPQVLADHRAALAVGNLDAIDCNYSPDATLIADGGIDVGHDQIRASTDFFLQIYGGTQPVVVQEIAVQVLDAETSMVRVLFTIDTPCVIVPDGVDTYLVRKGQIHAQTSHAFPVFLCF